MSPSNACRWTGIFTSTTLAASSAFTATSSAPSPRSLSQSPSHGADGANYIASIFAETCVAERNTLDELIHVANVPGWSVSFEKTSSAFHASNGRDGWPTISVKRTSNYTSCVVAWTIDPNTGVGSVQKAVEDKLGITLDGRRVTSGPGQTIFNGTDAVANALPHILLYEKHLTKAGKLSTYSDRSSERPVTS